MALIESNVTELMLNTLGNATTGINRISIHSSIASTIIGAEKVIIWAAASGGSMSMSSADLVFSVPEDTIVASMVLWFNDGTSTSAIINVFEQQYTYSNAGTFTITDVTLTVS